VVQAGLRCHTDFIPNCDGDVENLYVELGMPLRGGSVRHFP